MQMYDDDKDLKDDQEFQMPHDNLSDGDADQTFDVPEEEQIPPGQEPGVDPENMDTTYYAIMGLIGAVMLYILYSMYLALVPVEEKEIIPATTTQTTPAVQQPAPVIRVPSQPTQESPAVDQAPVRKQTKEPTALAQQLKAHQSAIESITDDTEYLENAQKDLSDKMDGLSAKVDKLMNQIDDMIEAQKDRDLVKKRQQAQAAEQKELKANPPVQYYLRAVVEGRAWLQTDDGIEATVSVGQSLKDYGTVVAIYVNQGVVTTTSGRVIAFRANEQ